MDLLYKWHTWFRWPSDLPRTDSVSNTKAVKMGISRKLSSLYTQEWNGRVYFSLEAISIIQCQSQFWNISFCFYQLPLVLTVLLQVDLTNEAYLLACVFTMYQVTMTLHVLNDVFNIVETKEKMITCTPKSLVWRSTKIEYQVRVFWYQVYQARLREQVYQALLRERMLNRSANLAIQQAFSTPCLVNLLSKDTYQYL